MLAAGVSSRRLPRVQRHKQSPDEVTVARFVGAGHGPDHPPSSEDVALDGVVLPGEAPGPIVAVRAREGRRALQSVHDAHLALGPSFACFRQKRDGLAGGPPLGHQLEPARPVGHVRQGLRRHRPDPGNRGRWW